MATATPALPTAIHLNDDHAGLRWQRATGFVLFGLQLSMLYEVSEQILAPATILVVGLVLWLVTCRLPRWKGMPVWLVGGGVVAGFQVLHGVHPVELAPGQSAEAMEASRIALVTQIALLSRRPFPALRITFLAGVALCALSILDFASFQSYDVGYGTAAVVATIVMLAAPAMLSDSIDSHKGIQGLWQSIKKDGLRGLAPQRASSWLSLGLLATIVIVGAITSTLVANQMPTVRRWFASNLALPVQVQTTRRTVGFSGDGILGSITRAKVTDSLYPALRVYTEKVPGYLRARVFDEYKGRRWQRIRSRKPVRALGYPAGPKRESGLFRIGIGQGNGRSMRIENQPGLIGYFFLPLESTFLRVPGDRINLNRHDAVMNGPAVTEYLTYTTTPQFLPSTPQPINEMLWQLPADFDPRVGDLADSIVAGMQSDDDKINAISTYLRTNYEYSLDPFRHPPGAEPVSHFLLTKAPTHCEYFATGTVLMLRHLGIPARYVTGFLVTELEDEYQDYWVARNRDAHAWVEAYDRQSQRWVIVDSTPGSGIDDEDNNASATGTSSTVGEQKQDDSQFWAIAASWIRRPLAWFVIALTVTAIVYYWRRVNWIRSDPVGANRLWLERRMRRRGYRRAQHETLHQFAARVRAEAVDDSWLLRAADWHESYAEFRFAGAPAELLDDPRTWAKNGAS